MTIKFKAASGNHTGENWPICWTGRDEFGTHWSVTTNEIHGSELHTVSQGARGDAELIARLLNEYYNSTDTEPLYDVSARFDIEK